MTKKLQFQTNKITTHSIKFNNLEYRLIITRQVMKILDYKAFLIIPAHVYLPDALALQSEDAHCVKRADLEAIIKTGNYRRPTVFKLSPTFAKIIYDRFNSEKHNPNKFK